MPLRDDTAGGPGSPVTSDDGPVRLGLMPPLTGVVGIYGTEIVRAARIACQEVNERGGILGRPLELIVEDDGSLPESAVRAAEALADRHRCVAMIGNLLSNSRIAVAYRVAEPRRIPYLNFSFYEGSILSTCFFHFAALPNQQIDRMIPFMGDRYGRRMFFAGSNYEWPRGSIGAAKRALARDGGKILGETYLPFGVGIQEVDNLLDQVEEARPDVFVPYFAGVEQKMLLTRFTERGLKQSIAVVMGHYDEVMASTLSPEVREGFYSSNTYFMTVDTVENREYLRRLSEFSGVKGIWPAGDGILTNFGEGTYLCVKAFACAAQAAGSVSGRDLREALRTVEVRGPQGMVTMDPETQHASVNTFLSRCGRDGVFSIVETFGTTPPVLPDRYRHQLVRTETTLEDDIRLQARMLSHLSEGILLVKAADKVIVYNNAGAERLFGRQDGDLIGIKLDDLDDLDFGTPETSSGVLSEVLVRRGEWHGDLQVRRMDGTSMWCSVTASAFTHPLHGEVWLAAYRDVTELRRSLADKETLLREVHHRVKNNLQLISSYLYLQSRRVEDTAAKEALGELESRIKAMVLVHEHLYQAEDLARVDVGEYLRELSSQIWNATPRGASQRSLCFDGSGCLAPIEVALPLGMIVTELITNAEKHAFQNGQDGTVWISLAKGKDEFTLSVRDDGVGLPPGFSVDSSNSFGWRIVNRLVSQLGASLSLNGGRGTHVTLTLPCGD